MDDLGIGGEAVDAAGDAVVEAGAEGDEQVALLHGGGGGDGAVHAGHAKTERMVVGEHAAGHEGGDHLDAGEFDQFAQRFGGAGFQHAATGVDDGALGGEDESGGLFDHAGVAFGGGPVAGEAVGDLVVARPVPGHLVLEDVFRHVDEDGAGAAGGGDVEGLAHGEGEVVGGHDEFVVLGAAAGDADGVAFLEGVGANGGGADLSGDADHGDGVHVGVHERGDQVGGGGAGGDHGDAGASGDVGVALGHVAGALFVAHEDVADG